MKGLMWISIAINALLTLATYGDHVPFFLTIIMGVAVAVSILGALMVGLAGGAKNERETGARLVIFGCVLFVPIGMIGIIAARKILDEIAREDFESRREDLLSGGRSKIRTSLDRSPSRA